jgi:L-lactate dehydrogenase
VGAGNVGATFAYALLLSGLAAEIVLIDINRAKAETEAMDLQHTVPVAHPTRIWAGDYADCAGAIATVITAGVNQKPGETRLELLQRNATVFAAVVPEVVRHNRDSILVIATNPVDVLTYASLKLSGFPWRRVIGSGTILDTARFATCSATISRWMLAACTRTASANTPTARCRCGRWPMETIGRLGIESSYH